MSQSDVARYAAEYSSTTKLLANGKLQFLQTGMEFAAATPRSVLEAYAGGRAYKRALELRASESYNFAQHEPYIVPHKHRDEKHFLFCKLTNSTLPRRKDIVIGHVNGKRFRRRLKEAGEKRAELERIEAKRKEKREKAKEAGKKKRVHAEGNDQNGTEGGENEAQDVLEGILSDDDDAMGDGEKEASAEDEEMGDAGRDKIDELEKMDEEEGEENVFWTRGQQQRLLTDNKDQDDIDGDEGGDKVKLVPQSTPKVPATRKSARLAKSSKRVAPSPFIEMDQDGNVDNREKPAKSAEAESVAGKRTRPEKVPKKVRRPRQRRRASLAET